jgi:hypothetical protein
MSLVFVLVFVTAGIAIAVYLRSRSSLRRTTPATPRPIVDPLTLFAGKRVASVGELEVPTGALVVCDPLVFPDEPALARRIPPGRYPVEVSVIDIEPGHVRNGAMRLVVGPGSAVTAEHACGFGVDGGLACIMDDATRKLYSRANERLRENNDTANYYDDILAHELEDPPREWTLHRPDATSTENMAIAQSGWGDGLYDVHWLLDAAGEPVQLVVDFDLGRFS